MTALLRSALPGLIVWLVLWSIDGRPYSALPWIAGAFLVVWVATFGVPRDMRLSPLLPIALATGVWTFWRLTDPATGPGISGSPLSQNLWPYTGGAAILGLIAALAAWPKHEIKGARWLVFVILSTLVIGLVSGQAGGARGMVDWLLANSDMKWQEADRVVYLFRKSMHFLFYGFCAYGAFWTAWYGKWYAEVAAAFGLGFVLLLSGFDELRQTATLGRTASPWDVALDVAGAMVFLWIAARVARRSMVTKNVLASPQAPDAPNPNA